MAHRRDGLFNVGEAGWADYRPRLTSILGMVCRLMRRSFRHGPKEHRPCLTILGSMPIGEMVFSTLGKGPREHRPRILGMVSIGQTVFFMSGRPKRYHSLLDCFRNMVSIHEMVFSTLGEAQGIMGPT